MSVAVIGREGRVENGLAIKVKIGGSAGAQQQPVLAFGQGDTCCGTQEEGDMTLSTHAGVDIFLWHADEAEHVFGVTLRDLWRLTGPGAGIGHAFLRKLHEHAACGHFVFGDRWWRWHEAIARLQRVRVHGSAIDGHFIEPAIE